MDSLIEMKSLATQAANGTLGATERGFIGDQIESIGNDINEIANQTVYQGTELLNGTDNSGSLTLTFQTGERTTDTLTASINAVNVGELLLLGDASLEEQPMVMLRCGGEIQCFYYSYTEGTFTFSANATAADYKAFIRAIFTAINTMASNVNDIGSIKNSFLEGGTFSGQN